MIVHSFVENNEESTTTQGVQTMFALYCFVVQLCCVLIFLTNLGQFLKFM